MAKEGTLSNRERNLRWFESRGISAETCESSAIDLESRVPTFEFYSKKNELLYRKGRFPNNDGSKSFRRDRKGVAASPWNLQSLSSGRFELNYPLIITEGELDALSCLEVGHRAVISVPDGAQGGKEDVDDDGNVKIDPYNDGGLQWLWEDGKIHPDIAKFRRIIIATDGDEKGEALAQQLIDRIGRIRCFRMKYPDGCKDINEILDKLGADALLEWLYDKPDPVYKHMTMPFSEVPRHKPLESFDAGWSCINRHLRLTVPELAVITGPPNLGKSQWLRALLANLAINHGHRIGILDFEDGIDHYDRDFRKIFDWKVKDTSNEWGSKSFEEWANHHFVGYDMQADYDEQDEDLSWLESLMEEFAIARNCQWLVIDPWNEIEHIWSGRDTQATYLNRAIKRIKRLMRRYDMGVIIVAHPTKASGMEWSESTGLYGIEGGAAWNNKADHGITIHQDPSDPASVRRITISKSRNWAIRGNPGTVAMAFNPEFASWVEYAEGSQANVRTTVNTEEANKPGSSVTIDGDTPDHL